MKSPLLLAATFAVLSNAESLTISPKTPLVVQPGGTVKLSANHSSVEWSMGRGSKGTIDPDGTYHAPAHVTAKQSLAGCQVLPNNHVLNTRIDGLPVHPKSDQWMHLVDKVGRHLTTGRLTFNLSFPVNTVTSQTPSKDMTFFYTPNANGKFHVLPPADFKMESGFFTPPFSGVDRHALMVETDTCKFQEFYNFYPQGSNTVNNCPRCTSQSGVKYDETSLALPELATDAASLYIAPLTLHRDEVLAGAIHHAIRFSLAATFLRADHVWPAMANAGYNHDDVPPFGTRFRLRADFVSPLNNPVLQTLITQLKQYGLVLADIGGQWEMDAGDLDLYFDPQIRTALTQLATSVPPSAFEVVDESGLILDPNSGATAVDAETVVVRDRNGNTATRQIILLGTTIGAENQYLVFQAGAPPHKIQAWVNGSDDKSINWTLDSPFGTIGQDGTYTPPASLTARKDVLLVAHAHADPTVHTSVHLTLLPGGPIRINSGAPVPYKDSKGNTWSPDCCTSYGGVYDVSGPGWPSTPDIQIYKDVAVNGSDILYPFYVPPGNYKITTKQAEPTYTAPNMRVVHLESQGQLIYRDVDLFAQAGFKNPLDFELPATVGPDGKLTFAVRKVLGGNAVLAGFQILPDPGKPRLELSPTKGGIMRITQNKQFYAVPWYMSNKAVTWSRSPDIGTIDSTGLYKTPINPLLQDTPVTITATSTADPSLTASTVVTVQKGIPAIRVNCGGGQIVDGQNNVWAGDFGFDGGVTYDGGDPIKGAPKELQKLYQTNRYAYGTDSFSYAFTVPNGTYNVTLKWAEYRNAKEVAENQLHFKMAVTINGTRVLDNFDPVEKAGGVQIAYDQTFPVTVTKNQIRIIFTGRPGSGRVGAGINGIEIEPFTSK